MKTASQGQSSLSKTLILFCLLALSYLAALPVDDYALRWLHKASPVILLMIAMWRRTGLHPGIAVLALGFSALGDILLALPIQHSFEFGLGAFLLAQLAYTVCFVRWRKRPLGLSAPHALLVLAMFGLGYIILPAAGEALIPVTAYMLVISAMALSASVVAPPQRFILLGALIFVTSDSLIAVNKFITPLPYAAFLIMITYYLAQLLLFTGICRQLDRHAA